MEPEIARRPERASCLAEEAFVARCACTVRKRSEVAAQCNVRGGVSGIAAPALKVFPILERAFRTFEPGVPAGGAPPRLLEAALFRGRIGGRATDLTWAPYAFIAHGEGVFASIVPLVRSISSITCAGRASRRRSADTRMDVEKLVRLANQIALNLDVGGHSLGLLDLSPIAARAVEILAAGRSAARPTA